MVDIPAPSSPACRRLHAGMQAMSPYSLALTPGNTWAFHNMSYAHV